MKHFYFKNLFLTLCLFWTTGTLFSAEGDYRIDKAGITEIDKEATPRFLTRESLVIFLDENGNATLNPDEYNRETIEADCSIDRVEYSRTAFDCDDIGFHVIQVTAFDCNGLSATTEADVEVRNEIIPKFVARESFVLFLDENGKATLSPDQINRDNISANCGIDRIELSKTEFDCEDVGFHEVTVTAFDKGTYSFSTTADVEVRNEIIPKFIGRESFVLFLDENGKATLSPDQINRDNISANCGIDRIELSQTEFDCEDVGFHEVTVTAFDKGTYSFSTTADVEVRNEIIPKFIGRESFVLFLDENGRAILSPDQINRDNISANCGIDRIELSQTEFSCGDVGFNEVTVTAFDKGTYSFSTTADVEVRNEIIPKFTTRESFIIYLDENGTATLSPDQFNRETISANCGIDRIEFDRTDFDCGDIGDNVIKVTAFDNGTYSFETEADVEVRDKIAPVVVLSGDSFIELNQGDIYSELGAQVSDNCDATITIGGDQVNTEIPGSYTVTYNATDASGNAAEEITRTVNVIDTEGPVITANDITAFTRDDRCLAVVESYNVSATDASGVEEITFDLNEGTVFEQGITEVRVTATDVLGNSSIATFNVTVIDNVAPTVEAGNISLILDENGEANLTLPVAPQEIFSDDFESEEPGLDLTELNGWNVVGGSVDIFFPGQFGLPISNNALELSGNVNGAIESKNVILFEPGKYRLRIDYRGVTGDAAIAVKIGSLLDDSITEFVNEFYEPAEFDFVVTEATSATIRFEEFGEDLEFSGTLIDNVRILKQPDSEFINSVYDNCQVTEITVSQSDFTCEDVGMNQVTVTVADAAGNTTSTEIYVEVMDNIAPVAKAKDITAYLGPDGTVTIVPRDLDAGSSDNCNLTYSLSRQIFTCQDITTVPRVIKDKDKDRFKKKKKNDKGDNKSKKSKKKDKKKDRGNPPVRVVLTVTDQGGNESSAVAYVTILDTTAPVITEGVVTLVFEKGRKSALLRDKDLVEFASDNCSLKTIKPLKFAFTKKDIGMNMVSVIAVDQSGNVTNGIIQVNIVDISKQGNSIQMCVNGKNVMVKQGSVQRLLGQGASLGQCTPASADLPAIMVELNEVNREVLTNEPEISLSAYPNPATSSTTIVFSSEMAGRAVLRAFHSGRPMPIPLFDKNIEANANQRVEFNTSNLSSGVYILRLSTPDGIKNLKLLVRK